MKSRYMAGIGAGVLVLLLAGGAANASAQAAQGQEKPSLQKDKTQPGTPAVAPAAPAANAEEDAAFQGFQDAPVTDLAKKAQLGEEFLQKYQQSRYLPVVYSTLTMIYYSTGQIQKMTAAGTKAVELTPNDVQILAILGQTLPRKLSKDPAEAGKQLALAEQYSRRAVEVTPTLPKPANLSDEQFATAKSVVLAMAHGGLGLVHFHRQKYSEAIPELEQSVKMDPQPDPVNYFLLGIANEKTAHFDDAVAAFTKCAAVPNQLQASCKSGVEEAKKLAATQLSAPK